MSYDGNMRQNFSDISDCLIRGSLSGRGYRYLGLSNPRRTVVAHRYYYELANGPVPAGYELDHLCENKECSNLAHLEVVTHSENVRRAWASRKARTA